MRAGSQRGLGAVVLILALLIAAALYVGYSGMRSATSATKTTVSTIDSTRAFACKTNRQTAERDVQMWLVNHPGESPSFAALEADGAHIPTCPEGGTYSLDGVQVRCSKHE